MALHQWADEHMGEQNADTLMKSLPPGGWGDVATKDDLEALRAETKSEFDRLRAQLEASEARTKNEIDRLRAQLEASEARTKNEFDRVHAALEATRSDIEELREFIKQQVQALEAAWNRDLEAATALQRSYTDRQAFRLVIVFLIATLGALLGQSAIQYYAPPQIPPMPPMPDINVYPAAPD